MIEPLKVGVIGLGFFGLRHARIYAEHLCAELVGVCDRDPERTSEATRITGAAGFADYRALLGLPGLHAVSICLPDRLHEEAAIAAAEAGKAILLEKPLAHTASAARRIMEAVERNGIRLMVGHILRFDPRYVQTFHAAAPERLGEPIHLRAKRNGIRSTARRLGGASSILFYMGVHDVDAMQWIARSRIRRVYAQKRSVLGHGNEDALYAVVNFENGAIGSIDYSWAWPDGLMNGFRSALEIVGTRSATYLDSSDQGFFTVEDQGTSGGDTHLWPEVNGRIAGDLADELDHFVKATLSGQPYLQDPREALDAIPVLDALARSAETGLPVEVER
ncbi:Gfo/Idh/MocA family oxidoreductase [Mesorhizobium sp.]|uniref:Gfo/Idh/MocA family protein n=1 Tax=Mesorhizobium sp. TaxID=1871066 RepID=UPI0011FB3486|nr:Gfo/Idh/MocA family oxidoreductase [Mesorhizobium sp.]TIS59647.1 MAG: Gfo/Idh/MocA family oxidoreductase [Mesorhizobium sp.]TIS88087.1 MAG: Gfo/Idh/MocA family oxidoreductase [Mesorhizobium sp.]